LGKRLIYLVFLWSTNLFSTKLIFRYKNWSSGTHRDCCRDGDGCRI